MGLEHPYRLSNEELSCMSDDELRGYITELQTKLLALKGYGRRQYQKELTRAEKMLRTTEEDR